MATWTLRMGTQSNVHVAPQPGLLCSLSKAWGLVPGWKWNASAVPLVGLIKHLSKNAWSVSVTWANGCLLQELRSLRRRDMFESIILHVLWTRNQYNRTNRTAGRKHNQNTELKASSSTSPSHWAMPFPFWSQFSPIMFYSFVWWGPHSVGHALCLRFPGAMVVSIPLHLSVTNSLVFLCKHQKRW